MNLAQFDFNLLKVLYALLLTGSTKEAAHKLGVSPSAVSHALSRLRLTLGDPLFKRENNIQVPTPFALTLKAKLVPLFISLNDDLFTDTFDGSRNFKMVCPPALMDIITPTLSELSFELDFYAECIPYQRRSWREEVLDGTVDLVFAVGGDQNPVSSLKFETIGTSRLIIIYGEPLRSSLKDIDDFSLEQLVSYKHVYCLPWSQDDNELDRQLRRRGLFRTIGFKCPEYAQVIPAINSCPYIAVVPEPWLENQPFKHTVYKIKLVDSLAIGNLFMMNRKSMLPWKKKIISSIKSKIAMYYKPTNQ